MCAVFALHEKDDDAEERAWVAAQVPGIAVVRGESYEEMCIRDRGNAAHHLRRWSDTYREALMFRCAVGRS